MTTDEARMTAEGDVATASVEPDEGVPASELVVPASLAQAGLWSVLQIFPDCLAYTGVIAYRIGGPLDESALRGAFEEVIRRHESLRTRFASKDGMPVQVISPPRGFDLPVTDLRELPADAREARVSACIGAELEHRFDLERGPLVKAMLLRCGDEDYVLVANIHRLLADFWSLGVLARELNRAYAELAAGRRCDYSSPKSQYRHYAKWQIEELRRGAFDRSMEYWRRELEDLPALLNLPTDRPRPEAHSFRGALLKFTIAPELGRAVREFAAAEGMTAFAPLLAVFKVLMFRYSAQTDIVVGSPLAHRPRKEYEGLIGFFVNTLLLRTKLEADSSFDETVRSVWDTILRGLNHRDAPFEALLQELQPARTLSYHTLFQVMFAMQNVPREDLRLADLNVAALEVPVITSKFDLMWSILEAGDGYDGTVEYDTDLFDRTTVEDMVEQYIGMLASAVSAPGQRISRLPFSPAGRDMDADSRGGRARRGDRDDARSGPPGPVADRMSGVCRKDGSREDSAPNAISGSDEAFSSGLEESIAEIWRGLLDKEPIGPDDDFFALGGYSLLAARIIARINAEYAVQLPLRAMFEGRTIRNLSAVVEAEIRKKGQGRPAPIPIVDREGSLQASFGQERMWLISRGQQASTAYNVQFLLDIRGEINLEALRDSLRFLLERHESLRTTFAVESYEIRQVIHARMNVELQVLDFQSASEQDLSDFLQKEQGAVFELSTGPLLRWHLLQRGDAHHLLVVTAHHIIMDGWSMNVLIRDLAAAYSSFVAGAPPRLPELNVQYADHAAAQRAQYEGGAMSSELAYWRERLQGIPDVLNLHGARPRPESVGYAGATLRFALSRDLCARLKLYARRAEASPFMLMLSALQMLLHSHTGQKDVVVGVPVANRGRAELEDLVGLFVNTVLVRTRIVKETSFADVLTNVRRSVLDAFAHQELPFEKLVAELAPRRSRDRHPLFQIMFVFHEAPNRALAAGGATMELVIPPVTKSPFDITLSIAEDDDAFSGEIVYRTDLFDEEYIRQLLDEYRSLLSEVAKVP